MIEDLVVEAQRRCPREEGLEQLIGKRLPPDALNRTMLVADRTLRYEPPSAEDVTLYTDHDYPAWLAMLRKNLAGLHIALSRPSRYATAALLLRNNGTRPAEGVILTIAAHAGLHFTTKPPKDDTRLPKPPAPPKGHYIRHSGSVEQMLSSMRSSTNDPFLAERRQLPLPRNPNTFYQGYDDRATDEWRLTCDEFRHGDHELREIGILVPDDWKPTNTAITVTLTARNMSKPATKDIPVRVHATRCDTISAARALLDNELKPRRSFSIDVIEQE
jgi:hypothetical protein